jgi:hypothetical protein
MRRPIRVKSFFISLRDCFVFPFSQAASVATLPSALELSDFRSVPVGCSRFSRCCYLISASASLNASIGEINRKLPETERISYLGGHRTKYRRIKQEYQRPYPDGRLSFYSKFLTLAGFGFALLLVLGSTNLSTKSGYN